MSTSYFMASAAHGGSDSNPGTIGSPWLTKAHAQTIMVDGDVLNANGGDTFAQTSAVNWTVGVTIQSYGTGKAAFSSATTGINLDLFTNIDGWSFSNVVMSLPTATTVNKVSCISYASNDGTTRTRGISITNCNLSGGYETIAFNNQTDQSLQTLTTNITISGNAITGGAERAISLIWSGSYQTPRHTSWYSAVSITNNTITNIFGLSGGVDATGILLTGANVVAGPCNIQGNTCIGMGSTGGSSGLGIWCSACDGVVMQNNVVGNITLSASNIDGACYDIDQQSSNCVVQYNFGYNADGPGLEFVPVGTAFSGNICRYNVFYNVSRNPATSDLGGISVSIGGLTSNSGGLTAYGNLVVTLGTTSALQVTVGSFTMTFAAYNNCLISPAGTPAMTLPASMTGITINGNYYQSGVGLFAAKMGSTTYTSLAAWQTAIGLQEANGVGAGNCYLSQPAPIASVTPGTMAGIGAYAPVAGNPLIGAGASLAGVGITPGNDIRGNAWTQNCIGPFYANGTPTGYMSAVYADSPMAVWRCAEPSGTTMLDSTANFLAGAWSGATLNQPTIVPGDGGTCPLFNSATPSTGKIATLPHAYALTSCTIEAWFKPSSVTGAQVVFSGWTPTTARGLALMFINGTTLNMFFRDAGNGVQANYPGVTFAVGTLYHVVATWTGTTQTCYVNGVSVTPTFTQTTALASGLDFGNHILIGTNENAGPVFASMFNGLISDVALYPSVLSSTRAAAHYNAGIASPSNIFARRNMHDRIGSRGAA